jgi:ATP-binding protein involved in chromosome partitioning
MTEECDGKCSSCAKFDGCTDKKKQLYEEEQKLKITMGKIKHKVAVISGKGGVGKSTVTVNLAIAFAWRGYRVGILDADIHGPCVPKMLGMEREQLQAGPPGIFPALGPLNTKVVSMAFLLQNEDTPIIWRGPLKISVIKQFLSEIVWGDLDFLFIDLPPGTGDEPLSVMQFLPDMDGVIIVTTPSEVAQIVVRKAVVFAQELKIPIIGIIENMSGFICPKCGAKVNIFKEGGGKRITEDLKATFLGCIPIDSTICEDCDEGLPFIVKHSNSATAKVFMEIVKKIENSLSKKQPELTAEAVKK